MTSKGQITVPKDMLDHLGLTPGTMLRALAGSPKGADFPGALIAEACRSAGCSSVVSFDRRAGRLLGFTAP